jgi:aminoglycoside 6'-N-acetyltransferase I
MRVREAAIADLEALSGLRARLWPAAPLAKHREETRAILEGTFRTTQPQSMLVAEADSGLIGFAEVGLRSHADGCDPSRPCGYLEGWYVEPEHRRRGVGRALVAAAEAWCREQGCVEMASDTWLDSAVSQRAHAALGFEVVDRCVNYRKTIASPVGPREGPTHYGAELARIHHRHFGATAEAAARELLGRLGTAGLTRGTVVDLAAGSGILARRVTEAGFSAWGVDLSEEMLRIARAEAPAATFVRGSLWSAELPPCVAVAAVGEVFCYAADPAASLAALETRLRAVHGALAPGGLLLFDIAGPGRSGPGGVRRTFRALDGAYLGLEEREVEGREATRDISLFLPRGELFAKVEETHVLRLYTPEAVEARLDRAGFSWERLPGYDGLDVRPGWHAFAAVKR